MGTNCRPMRLLSKFVSSLLPRSERIFCDSCSTSACKAFSLEGHQITHAPEDAELLWMRRDYRPMIGQLQPHQLINHFSAETAIINKGRLTGTLTAFEAQSDSGQLPVADFYPETYRLYVPSERAAFFAQLPAKDDRETAPTKLRVKK